MADFYGVAIWDSENPSSPYWTEVSVNQSIQKVFKAIVNEPVNQRYPVVIYPSATNYMSGSASGNFADNSDPCNIDFDNTLWKLQFTEWLTNFRTKYLKLSDDLIIPVAVTAVSWDIEDTVDSGYSTKVNFEWVQVSDSTVTGSSFVECPNCRAILSPNANYCHMCGKEVEK